MTVRLFDIPFINSQYSIMAMDNQLICPNLLFNMSQFTLQGISLISNSNWKTLSYEWEGRKESEEPFYFFEIGPSSLTRYCCWTRLSPTTAPCGSPGRVPVQKSHSSCVCIQSLATSRLSCLVALIRAIPSWWGEEQACP